MSRLTHSCDCFLETAAADEKYFHFWLIAPAAIQIILGLGSYFWLHIMDPLHRRWTQYFCKIRRKIYSNKLLESWSNKLSHWTAWSATCFSLLTMEIRNLVSSPSSLHSPHFAFRHVDSSAFRKKLLFPEFVFICLPFVTTSPDNFLSSSANFFYKLAL